MKTIRLTDCCELVMGQSPVSSSYNTEKKGLPFYQGNADFGKINPITRCWCDKPIKIAHEGDILISVRAPIGAINIANEECCIGRGLAAIRALKEKCLCEFLYYALQGKTEELRSKGTGSTFKAISKQILSDTELPDITLKEQGRIVNQLLKVDELIENANEQLSLLDQLVKSRFIEMFGNPISNPKGWEKVRLADKCSIITGNTPSRANKEFYGYYIEWIKSDNITNLTYLTKAVEFLSEKGLSVGRKVDSGSILMTCIAGSLKSIGNVAIVNRPVAFNQQINAIIPNKQNTLFMYEQFKLSKEYIISDVNMALKGILSKGNLSEKLFIFPPIELQNQFADFVEQANKSKLEVQKSLEELETLKKSLMQQYFG